MAEILTRVRIRLPDEANIPLLEELIHTAIDRINLRLGSEELPSLFESICVDVVIKMYRRIYYEGISSESADTLNTGFVEDILAEYEDEFSMFIANQEKKKIEAKKKVRFI